jgi:hypothetical protein
MVNTAAAAEEHRKWKAAHQRTKSGNFRAKQMVYSLPICLAIRLLLSFWNGQIILIAL